MNAVNNTEMVKNAVKSMGKEGFKEALVEAFIMGEDNRVSFSVNALAASVGVTAEQFLAVPELAPFGSEMQKALTLIDYAAVADCAPEKLLSEVKTELRAQLEEKWLMG